MKKKLFFRRNYFNTLTIPYLLNIVENSHLFNEFELVITDEPDSAMSGDLLIYSTMTPFLPELADEMARLSQKGVQIVVGGPHVDFENHELLLEMGAISTSAAPAEKGLIPLLEAYLDGCLCEYPFWPDESISSHELSCCLPLTKLLPTVPPLELMRGCGYSCAFCATSGQLRKIRTWPSIKVYLNCLQERGGRRVNFIVPSALEFKLEGCSVEESLQVLFEECVKNQFKFIEYGIFPSEIRPETVTREKVKILKNYVVNRNLTIGLQSGYKPRLQQGKRDIDDQLIKHAVDTILSAGFGLNLDLIVGFPQEDFEEFSHSIEKAMLFRKYGNIRLQIHRFFPLGNSPWQWAKPSEIDAEKHNVLNRLECNGILSGGWRLNDNQWRKYWDWLEKDHPCWAVKYF